MKWHRGFLGVIFYGINVYECFESLSMTFLIITVLINIVSLRLSKTNNYKSNFVLFNLKEFRITETELKLIAAAAIIGLNKIPKKG